MANRKVMEAVISIAGTIDPSLQKSLNNVTKLIGGINFKAIAAGAIAGKAIYSAGKAVVGTVKAGVEAVANVTSEAVQHASGFQKQMSNVATLLDGDVDGRIAQLNDEVLKVSNSTGIMTSNLTDGLYQVISAFGDTAESSKTLEIAAKAAKAGNATTTDAINLLSAVTKGYGNTSAEAQQKAADLAFQTVKLGQTSFPELAASMGKVIPLANTMGVSQEELFGATATLTGVTGNTAEVMTQLRGTIQGFLQPTKAMENAMVSLGYADGQALLQTEGLQGALNLLNQSVDGNQIAFANLFGSVEAKNAVLALVGNQADALTQKTQAMYEATGAATGAFNAQTNNLQDIAGRFSNLKDNFLTKIGVEILPVVQELAATALPLVEEFFDSTAEAIQGLAPMLADMAAQLMPVLKEAMKSILPTLVSLVQTLVPPFGEIVKALLPPLVKLINALLPLLEPVLNILSPIADILGKIVGWVADIISWGADKISGFFSMFTGGKKDTASVVVPAYARGGFTNGIAVVGEDPHYPTEAVISFNPSYRTQNIQYWNEAGRRLGVYENNTTESRSTQILTSSTNLLLSPQLPVSAYPFDMMRQAAVPPGSLEVYQSTQNVLPQIAESPTTATEQVYQIDTSAPLNIILTINPAVVALASAKQKGCVPESLVSYLPIGNDAEDWNFETDQSLDLPDNEPDLLDIQPHIQKPAARQITIKELKFSPVITVQAQNISPEDIVNALRDYEPEFADFLRDTLAQYEEDSYESEDIWIY